MKKVVYILIASITLIAIILIGLTNNLDKVSIKEKVYFYSHLQKMEYDKVQLKSKNGNTTLEKGNESIILESDPIYYVDGIRMILPKDMAIVNSQNGTMNKIIHFSEIHKDSGKVTLIEKGKEKILRDFFLYDGEDTYVFFDEIEIKNGNQVIKVAPFTHVKLFNNSTAIEIYSKTTDKLEIFDIAENKITVSSNYGYSLDLKLGVLKTSIGEQLLFKEVGALEKY